MPEPKEQLNVAVAQIAPVCLKRNETLEKVEHYIKKAAERDSDLVVFGEAVVPGYPFWVERTQGATFDSPVQKELHARYAQNAVRPEAGDLDGVCGLAREHKLAVYLGCIERAADRGGHSLYCSLVYVNRSGEIGSVHRKLVPTYEERLTWSPGDGHGLVVHPLEAFTVGGLNCWENWMPLPRAAMYGQGEDLHCAVWPGGLHNTELITRFMAKEGRSYVISACGLVRPQDYPADTPYRELIVKGAPEFLANGGSCIAGPDGEWIVEPVVGREGLFTARIDHARVLQERQNFDPVGHYSRPDVTRLEVNRTRQSTLVIKDQ